MQADEPKDTAACLVVLCGALEPHWADYLGNLTLLTRVSADQQVSTILSGPVADFAAFAGIITHLQNLGVSILSISFQSLPSRFSA